MPQYIYDIYNVVFIVTLILFAIGLPFLLMSQGDSAKMVGYSLTISFVEVCAVGLTYFFARGAAYLSINSNEWVLIAIIISIVMVVGNASLIVFWSNNNPNKQFGSGNPFAQNQRSFMQNQGGFQQNQGGFQQNQGVFQQNQGYGNYAPAGMMPQQHMAQHVRVSPISNPYGAGGSNPYNQMTRIGEFPTQPQF